MGSDDEEMMRSNQKLLGSDFDMMKNPTPGNLKEAMADDLVGDESLQTMESLE